MKEIIYAKVGGKNVQVSSGRQRELKKVTTKGLGEGVVRQRDGAVAGNCYKGPHTMGQGGQALSWI